MDWILRLKVATQEATGSIPMALPVHADELPTWMKQQVARAEISRTDRQRAVPDKDWRPEPKAWLTDSGDLRTRGVFDSLAVEIVRLTVGNLPLQAKLLRLHVGIYSGPAWKATILRWKERAAHLSGTEGKQLFVANLQAAAEMNLLAFADELNLEYPVLSEK